MSQNGASQISQDDSINNRTDSLMNEPLLTIAYWMDRPKQGDQEEPLESSSPVSSKGVTYPRLQEIKAAFISQRASIFKGTPFGQKQVINALVKNHQLEGTLSNKTKELKALLQVGKDDTDYNKKLQLETKQLDNEIRLLQQMTQFKTRIKATLEQSQNPILNLSESRQQIKSQLLSSLQKRSDVILEKLKPYLDQHIRINAIKNHQLLQHNSRLENIDGKAYQSQVKRLESYIQKDSTLKGVYNLHDQLENERNYGRELDKYIKRN